MRVPAIVCFFVFLYFAVTHALAGDVGYSEPLSYSDENWGHDFNEEKIKEILGESTVSNKVVRRLVPLMLANSLTMRTDSVEEQMQTVGLNDQVDEQKIEDAFFLRFDTAKPTVLLSDLANAGFFYEKNECSRLSYIYLVLQAYHTFLFDVENSNDTEKNNDFFGDSTESVAELKKEVEPILKKLAEAFGVEVSIKIASLVENASSQSWDDIKTLRENKQNTLPVLILYPGNIAGHRVYQCVKAYAYRDLKTLQAREKSTGYAAFHDQIEKSFANKEMTNLHGSISCLNDFKAVLFEVLENRGVCFGDKRAVVVQKFGPNADDQGVDGKTSLDLMARTISWFFCGDDSYDILKKDTGPAGRALVIETMAWLVETYRAKKETSAADYLSERLNSLLLELPREDYPICYSLTGVSPFQVKKITDIPSLSSSPAQAVTQQVADNRVVFTVQPYSDDWACKLLKHNYVKSQDEFIKCIRHVLTDDEIAEIQSYSCSVFDRNVKMLRLVAKNKMEHHLPAAFADPDDKHRFDILTVSSVNSSPAQAVTQKDMSRHVADDPEVILMCANGDWVYKVSDIFKGHEIEFMRCIGKILSDEELTEVKHRHPCPIYKMESTMMPEDVKQGYMSAIDKKVASQRATRQDVQDAFAFPNGEPRFILQWQGQ